MSGLESQTVTNIRPRSISVPDRLGELVAEIQKLEQSVVSKNKALEQKKKERSMSFHDLEELKQQSETGFFVPSGPQDDESQEDSSGALCIDDSWSSVAADDDFSTTPMQPGYFVPGYEEVHGLIAATHEKTDVGDNDQEVEGSDAMPVVTEEASSEQDEIWRQQQKAAQEVVSALAGFSFLPQQSFHPQQSFSSNEKQSPSSFTRSPTSVIDALHKTAPQQVAEQRAENDDLEDDRFQLLTPQDRTMSLPSKLPSRHHVGLKPSLKSTSSIATCASQGSLGVNSSTGDGMKRTVSFGTLKTREYNISLSDNPACSFGPPISLGWEYKDKEAVAVEDYEKQRTPRRTMEQMVLSYNVRRYLLLKRAGYSKAELKAAMCEVERVKRERLVTDLLLPTSVLDETVEGFIERIKSIFAVPEGRKQERTSTLWTL